jgi:RimJ/RimL family protein N-acetyltransferase
MASPLKRAPRERPSLCIESRRLLLRQLTVADAWFIVQLVNDPDWLAQIGDRGVRSLEDAVQYIESGPMAMYRRHGFGLLAIIERDTGTAVGLCGLLQRDGLLDVDIGYALLPSARGRGYAREAVAATLDWAGQQRMLKRVAAFTKPDNLRSIALLEALGFSYEQRLQLQADGDELSLFGYRF